MPTLTSRSNRRGTRRPRALVVVATLAVLSELTGTASGGVVITLAERPDRVAVETSGGAVVLGS